MAAYNICKLYVRLGRINSLDCGDTDGQRGEGPRNASKATWEKFNVYNLEKGKHLKLTYNSGNSFVLAFSAFIGAFPLNPDNLT